MRKKSCGSGISPSRKIMNVTRILFLVWILAAPNMMALTSYSRSVHFDIRVKNATLAAVFEEIEKNSEFSIIYLSRDVDLSEIVSVNVHNQTVDAILDKVLKKQSLQYEIKDRHIIIYKQASTASAEAVRQQTGERIHGTVTDIGGEPLVGVSIIVKGTAAGVTTDMDGKFEIRVNPGDALQISYIGYVTRTVTIGNEKVLNVILQEDEKVLDEIVVIGYGTAKKSDLAGSVVRADLGTLKESPNVSLASALQGTVPGLNVGAVTTAGTDPNISIRGINTISGTTAPLVVLDGIIFRGNLVDINPNDIESVDVLKDASAAAIYGSQATNGVILITTKAGRIVGKPILEYSGSYSMQELSTERMKPMNRAGFLQFVADRFLEESRTGDDLSQPNPNWDVANRLMDAKAIDGYLNGTDTNWWDIFTNDHPYIQSHDLSIRGKSELSSYYMSIGYISQNNVMINDTYERYNIRVNLDTKVTDWLRVGTQSFFTMSDYSGASPSITNVVHLPPLASPTDENGETIILPYLNIYNPMKEMTSDDLQKRYNLMGNFYLDLNVPFIEGLNYRMNFSQNLITEKAFTFRRKDESDLANGNKSNTSQYDWTADNILTYKRRFGKHDINATFVYGAEKREYESTGASGTNYTNTVLGYNFLQGAQANQQYITSSAWQETSLYSMLRLAYVFDNRYIFTGTVRRDGFSGFGKDNKFGVFPSAAVAWRISEEDFFREKVNWVNDLKLRLSYGINGNRTVSNYQTLAKIGFSDAYLYGDGASAEKGITISSMANPGLKWETTKTFNAGLDFELFNGRVYGTFDYYNSSTYDMLYTINLPNYNMVWSNIGNMGNLSNWGTELTVTGVPVNTKDFSWDVTFNYSLNRNKVVSITGVDADGDGKEDDMIASNIFIGKPYGVIYDYRQIGMWQMEDHLAGRIPSGFMYGSYKIKDLDGDEKITAANDREILGYTDPSYRFSIQNTLRYKNWQLKFFINSIQGGKDYYYGRPGSPVANPDYIYQYNSFDFDYWTPENPNARYRQIGAYPAAIGSSYAPLVQRNFIRLQDVTLSYALPAEWLKSMKINNLKVYLTGKNLLTISDWDGWDPEIGTGLTETAYPLMRSYTLGINFSF